MKKAGKIIAIVLAVCIVISGVIFGFVKKEEMNYFFSAMSNAKAAINDGSWKDDGSGVDLADVAFVPGTYGSVEFKDTEDVLSYYKKVYDNTKAETAEYIDSDGNTVTLYDFLGTEDLVINSVLVEGKENSIINGLVPGIVNSLFDQGVWGLPPCAERAPEGDIDEDGVSLVTSRLTIEDIQNCDVKDNGDGTITLIIQPKAAKMSHKGMDSQGRMFNALGAIDDTVDSISVLSWASGTTAENCLVNYEGGSAVVTVDTNTEKIVEADYNMGVEVVVNHANVSVIKDKSAGVSISYKQHFPASDDYLKDSRGIVRK